MRDGNAGQAAPSPLACDARATHVRLYVDGHDGVVGVCFGHRQNTGRGADIVTVTGSQAS